jgi:hypothetical protein
MIQYTMWLAPRRVCVIETPKHSNKTTFKWQLFDVDIILIIHVCSGTT